MNLNVKNLKGKFLNREEKSLKTSKNGKVFLIFFLNNLLDFYISKKTKH
jgi:hypothetical protein